MLLVYRSTFIINYVQCKYIYVCVLWVIGTRCCDVHTANTINNRFRRLASILLYMIIIYIEVPKGVHRRFLSGGGRTNDFSFCTTLYYNIIYF